MINIKINKPTNGYKKDQVVKVETSNGVPVLKFWRDQLKDAEIDNNCEIVKSKRKSEVNK